MRTLPVAVSRVGVDTLKMNVMRAGATVNASKRNRGVASELTQTTGKVKRQAYKGLSFKITPQYKLVELILFAL